MREGEAAVVYTHLETRDFDEMALALRGLRTDFRQLSGGPFRGEVELAAVGSLRLMRIALNRVIQARGAVAPGGALVSLITPRNEGASWRGRKRTPGDVNMNTTSTPIDHLTSKCYENVMVIVEADRLRSAACALGRTDLGPLLATGNTSRPSPQSFAHLVRDFHALMGMARSDAEPLRTAACRDAAEAALLASLFEALAGPPAREEKPLSNGHRLAGSAEEYMRANLHRSVPMAEVCAEFDVSERALRYAFQGRYGTSPLAHFKALRLNAIRRYIIAGNGEVGVQEVARRWGIVHLGNFAADYSRLFGELPSATAGRR